ncbi:hypothetical protein GCM10010435_16160 [Winogradskya consettensis]|uniref:Uncharacterized protein n=2 Tax=Winogradskya TaxID=3240235 RepID=A0A919VX09_9ACTN|nr:hypothetical protein Ahu01nite_057670 [Actinoplanes humidus]GIM78912.1 hypothetical protein Aco04nite_62900 [Actinoplanes consettensis]
MTTITTPYRKTEDAAMTPNGTPKVRLIQEALSRARMRRPQEIHTPEAHRPARQIAMEARHRAANELGGRL